MGRYKKVSISGNLVGEHRAIWESVHGPIPKGYEIHHKDGDGNNNRIENLVMLTRKEHMTLHAKLRSNGLDPVDEHNPDVIKERDRQSRYRSKHRDELSSKQKSRYVANRANILQQMKEYREANPEKIAERKHSYYLHHKSEIGEKVKAYRASNGEKIAQHKKTHYEENKARILEQQREYFARHREAINARNRARHKLRRAIESGKSTNVIERLKKEYEIAKVNNPLTNNK